MIVTITGIESQTDNQPVEEYQDIAFDFAGEYFSFGTDGEMVSYCVPWNFTTFWEKQRRKSPNFTALNREIVDFIHKVNGNEEISLDFEELPTILRCIFSELLNR